MFQHTSIRKAKNAPLLCYNTNIEFKYSFQINISLFQAFYSSDLLLRFSNNQHYICIKQHKFPLYLGFKFRIQFLLLPLLLSLPSHSHFCIFRICIFFQTFQEHLSAFVALRRLSVETHTQTIVLLHYIGLPFW